MRIKSVMALTLLCVIAHAVEMPDAFNGKKLWILEAGSAPEVMENTRQLIGRIVAHPPEATALQTKTFAESRREGHNESGMTLRYELPADFPGGEFQMAALYTTGGHVTLQFTFRQTGSDDKQLTETKRSLRSTSWKEEYWQPKETINLLPGKSSLEVTMSGKSSNVKKLTRVVLAAVEPVELSADQAALRQRLMTAGQAGAPLRLLLLEDGKPADDALFRTVGNVLPEGRVAIEYHHGETARQLSRHLELPSMPAAVLCDAENRVVNMTADPAAAVNFFSAAPVYLKPEAVPVAWVEPGQEMLVAGTWAGPAGLSLMGLDAEAVASPVAGDAVPVMYWDRRINGNWRVVRPDSNGRFLIEKCANTYAWPRGSAYGFCYLQAEKDAKVELTVEQSGSETFLWLDGQAVKPVKVQNVDRGKRTVTDVTDQGNPVEVEVQDRSHITVYSLNLKPGSHRLLVKFIMAHQKDEFFDFAVKFGGETDKVHAAMTDPAGTEKLHRTLTGLAQQIGVNAPSNLPHAGDPLKITTRLALPGPRTAGLKKDWPVLKRLGDTVMPVVPFEAVLHQKITDYSGREIRSFQQKMIVPGEVTFDFGAAPEMGYYAVQTELLTLDGRRIGALYPDGFSVIGGIAARKQRLDALKMVSSFYWIFPSNVEEMTDWMARLGVFHNIGSGPGYSPEVRGAFERKGLTLTADFIDAAGKATREERFKLAKEWSSATDKFKSYNEIDIHRPRPAPEQWVARTREEYEAVKAANPKAEFTGGTYVRPAVGDWFTQCIELGLDQWVDRWDVHAYPKVPPRLGARYLGNSPSEDAAGVDKVYGKLGRKNPHPFVMGETGARCGHGRDARRWQADTVAKMLAWALSRADYSAIAYLVPWWKMPDGWDIPVAHHPAEAAMYTAGVLIDGYPAEILTGYPPHVDAARFGRTVMAWSSGKNEKVKLQFPAGTPLVKVDVVGKMEKLAPAADGSVEIELTGSPVYVLPEQHYRELIR